jgi:hypothetical protein
MCSPIGAKTNIPGDYMSVFESKRTFSTTHVPIRGVVIYRFSEMGAVPFKKERMSILCRWTIVCAQKYSWGSGEGI